jgi:hypothetical protein
MKFIVSWIKNNPIRTMFLIPIILVAAISISHVVTWYSIANPINWAIYLSIAIEVGAMTALVAATNRVKGGVWFMFGLVTFIQMVGNIYFCFKEIDTTGELWYSWIELTTPVWEMVGTELTDTLALKRWLAFLEGGLLPIISLTSLHFFVKFDQKETEEVNKEKIIKEYFDARNKKMVEVVESSKEYNPMTEHPEDVYYPEKKEEVIEESSLPYTSVKDEPMEKEVNEDEVPWEEDPEVLEFLENEDNSDVYDSEEDKVHLVAGMTNDKDGDFMKFQKSQEKREEEKSEDNDIDSEDLLKKAMDEYNIKKEEKPKPSPNKPNKIIHGVTQTLTGKAKTKKRIG